MNNLLDTSCGAVFSSDRNYRYALWRMWEKSKPYALFIGLNPSTADESEDDPTIRRCIRFASEWGYGGVCMANIFAIRATDPKVMLSELNPKGLDNDIWLNDLSSNAGVVVCAWGTHGAHLGRGEVVKKLLADYQLKCLGLTKYGYPRHPLYVKADKQLEPFG